ncbi:hypothetical protein [Azospirillum soli]|uniref:hypothetical protein n=1 Tax=Azospirillum soli TaxID=1304799 RepID=UPI001AE429C1|nr:hypothetical protein [Azospirillum soli]MBP2311482.1 hypothetical protein [Azospirillum soli]
MSGAAIILILASFFTYVAITILARYILIWIFPALQVRPLLAIIAASSLVNVWLVSALILNVTVDRAPPPNSVESSSVEPHTADLVFIVPPKLNKDDQHDARARLSVNVPAIEIERALLAEGRPDVEYKSIVAKVRTEMVMAAELSGGKVFDIEPKGQQLREFGVTGEADWAWRITPLKRGEHYLTLTVLAMVPGHTSGLPRFHRVLERKILVEVSPLERVGEFLEEVTKPLGNLQSLWAAMIVPIGAALYGFYQWLKRPAKRKPKNGPKSGPKRPRK